MNHRNGATLIRLAVAFATTSLASAVAVGPVQAASGLTTLQPGGVREISQDLTVTVVLVGYQPGTGQQQVDPTRLVADLPTHVDPLVRYPHFYGIVKPTHVHYRLTYRSLFAGAAFDDAFFGYLAGIATPKAVTSYQQRYNGQHARSLTVTDNETIDAAAAESWLATNAGPMLGVDTAMYTVFLVNWYGRADFRFHVYTHTGEPDHDLGVDDGAFDPDTMRGWGGTSVSDRETPTSTPRRLWFDDQSAGPDINDWVIDAATDADSGAPYTIPPVWEYGSSAGYRPFTDLSGDLGKLLRYVVVDCLFFTSPLYDPAITAPKLPDSIELDVNYVQADPGSDARSMMDPAETVDRLGRLQPFVRFSAAGINHPYDGRLADVYQCFKHWFDVYYSTGTFATESCYGARDRGIAGIDLLLYSYADQLPQFITGHADYDIPILDFHTTPQLSLDFDFADDNWRDGTQSYIYINDSPAIRDIGGGASDLTVHEVGHHLGLSHPHDGYDTASGIDFSPSGPFYFTWEGDWSSTVMNYTHSEFDFSQFNLDDMDRWMTAAYINQANAILGRIAASPGAAKVTSLVAGADQDATAALAAYASMDYATAVTRAHAAYRGILAAAAAARVPVEPEPVIADIKARAPDTRFIDPPRLP